MNKQHNFTGLADLSKRQLVNLLDLASEIAQAKDRSAYADTLAGKVIATMFFEPSTRTRGSFTMAAYRLGAQVLDINPSGSSLLKGETIFDTFLSLQAMRPDLFVIRCREQDIIRQLASQFNTPLVNAGDGRNEHPSQTLLDLLTISLQRGETKNLKIVLVGDIAHSRVATSFIRAMEKLGCGELCLAGPPELLPDSFAPFKVQTEAAPELQTGAESQPAPESQPNAASPSDSPLHIKIERDLDRALTDADIIMMLRIQKERIAQVRLQQGILRDTDEYFSRYGLSAERLRRAKQDVLVMHPGPVNRGVEISSEVADSPNSMIIKQVEYGVYARMAIFLALLDTHYAERVWG